MHGIRGSLAIAITISLALGQGLPVVAAERADRVREKVERLGAGADVRVYDSNGNPLRGIIESFDESGFHLRLKETDKTFRYHEVNVLELAQSTYSAKGEPNPAAARRLALEMGPGTKVAVRTTTGASITGKIVRVDGEELAIGTKTAGSIAVRYSDMRELKRSSIMPVMAKVGIGAVVGIGFVGAIFLAIVAPRW